MSRDPMEEYQRELDDIGDSEREMQSNWLVSGAVALVVALVLTTIFSCSRAPGPTAPTPPGSPAVAVVDDSDYDELVQSFAAAMATAAEDSVPPVIQIAVWLAQVYPEISVVHTPPLAFSALAPSEGSTPEWYRWQFEVIVDEPPFPPELVEGIGYRVDATIYAGAEADSVRCRVVAVDGSGAWGPWSEWSRTYPVVPGP